MKVCKRCEICHDIENCPLCEAEKDIARLKAKLIEKQKIINDLDYRIRHAVPN